MTITAPTRPDVRLEVDEGLDVPGWRLAFRTITPAMAREMLAIPVRNRRVRKSLTGVYAGDMTAQRWLPTPEAIILDTNGGVLDGQHRLSAVIETGIARPFLVISNVDPSLISVLGIGRSRSPADVLDIQGEANSQTLAAAAKILHNYLTVPDIYAWGRDEVLTAPAVLCVLAEHPELRDYVRRGRALGQRIYARPGVTVAALYLTCQEKSMEEQEQGWFHPLTTGANLPPGSPVLALRNLLARRRSDKARLRVHGGVNPRSQLALYLTAWKAWNEGKAIRRLSEPERMPEVGLPTAKAPDGRAGASRKNGKGRGDSPSKVGPDIAGAIAKLDPADRDALIELAEAAGANGRGGEDDRPAGQAAS